MNEPSFSAPTPAPEAPRRADALPRGSVIADCEIGRVVADSSFSIVYFAREPKSERRFAIKEYLPVSLALRSDDGHAVALRAPEHAEAFERGLQAFAAEAELLMPRRHPALLRVLRTWRGNGSIYRVMPWLEGETLLTLRRGLSEPPDEETLRHMLAGLLGALQALHDDGQVHGAVSPGQVMVMPDGSTVLMDTGAVGRALVGEQTRALMALVSPGFAAPAGPVGTADRSPAADLRALAAVAHYAISGELAGARPAPLAAALRSLLQPPLGRPGYSSQLLDTIHRALAGEPNQALRSVAEFRAALAGHATAQPVEAPVAPAEAPGARVEPTLDVELPYIVAAAAGIRPSGPVNAGADRARGAADRLASRARRWTWLAAGAFATLVVGTVALVAVQAPEPGELRAGPVARPIDALPAPAADPLPKAAPAPAAVAPARPPVPASQPVPTVVTLPLEVLQAPPAALDADNKRAAPAPARPERPARAARPATLAAAPPGPASPREVCGARTEFALYRCMRTECARPAWSRHAQCQRLRETDQVD